MPPQMMSGWGLTADANNLYASDGSDLIFVIDPETFTVTSKFNVYEINGGSKFFVRSLNELEHVDGFIFANQFM